MFRPRRLRTSQKIRDFASDVKLDVSDFVFPLFLKSGKDLKLAVKSMPDIFQFSPDLALKEVQALSKKGLKKFLLFAVIDEAKKDECASEAFSPENPVNQFMRLAKDAGLDDVILIADLCFCEYSSHGHCGVMKGRELDNDATLEQLARQARVLVDNGADIVAPSGMIDGMVAAIRQELEDTPILSYTTKFASNLYGPFRDAAEGAPKFGDRKTYQMDFRRSREWQTELQLDISEGADMLMVKPASYYLDILSSAKQQTSLPIGAYQVSGEYSMIHAAAKAGYLDLETTAMESLYAIKRSGADFIVSYFAKKILSA